ncbi:class Ib ribonucleoside-diphosphate reductase assembly flavoprotein NrdI [Macrococcus capreoli]|uniref:class Ib ribonucleoside-diphosphate reductase assembly flavoprotein NrdI n=1 Tax=Macrococcus capreoli TaxID=2982690 RepID=UPI0021D5C4BA|nr:class Ib ribonucleoside-diphosphate reductase assembly flavoprotein NrdI [Macrococcus sp. TMW 2.2395]MCU7556572.1 class Ib ribonucleoside-diphosphate reductase assembly flavoprotein NrdI [Macrococcus sp. TMW 2.2395]
MKKIKIVYYSRTGNVKAFVERYLNEYETVDISEVKAINTPYVLITPTYDFGQVPEVVTKWLRKNNGCMVGVIASGNMAWGKLYGHAGDVLSDMYDVPLLAKFELRGNVADGMRIEYELERLLDEKGKIL